MWFRIPSQVAFILMGLAFAGSGRSLAQTGAPTYDAETKSWSFKSLHYTSDSIKGQFEEAKPFSETDKLAVVKEDGKYHFINRDGKPVFGKSFDFAGSFRDGVATVAKNGKFGLINAHGQPLTEMTFDDLGDLRNGLARAKSGGKYGFVDSTGKWVIPAKYEFVGNFSEGLAWFREGKKYGYIGIDRSLRIPPTYELADDFAGELAAVKVDGKYGYIDRNGKLVISAIFDACRPFQAIEPGQPPFAAVKLKGEWKVINTKGGVAINEQFDGVEGLIGLYKVDKDAKDAKVATLSVIPSRGPEPPSTLRRESLLQDTALMPFTFKSVPPGAEVYQIEAYDAYNKRPEDLVQPKYLVGNTDLPIRINYNKVWLIVFVRKQRSGDIIKSLPCTPGATDGELKALFE